MEKTNPPEGEGEGEGKNEDVKLLGADSEKGEECEDKLETSSSDGDEYEGRLVIMDEHEESNNSPALDKKDNED